MIDDDNNPVEIKCLVFRRKHPNDWLQMSQKIITTLGRESIDEVIKWELPPITGG